MNSVQILLLQIAVILLLCRLVGLGLRRLGQPQVVGEMLAGILLGPSLLGKIAHGTWLNTLFPSESMGTLESLSQLGVILFMFLVGLQLNPKLLRGQGQTALIVGAAGILVPFLGGAALAWGLADSPHSLPFCLFIGAAMSITAFPVLARILTERKLDQSPLGTLALACAAMNDCLGWCILAFVLALVHSNRIQTALTTILLAAAYFWFMAFIARSLLARLRTLNQNTIALVLLLLILSSAATGAIGIHPVFGAFLLGAVMPKEPRLVERISEKFEDVTVLLLLPLFFAFTGLRTQLALLNSPRDWMICGFIVLTAILGKLGGVSLAARLRGMTPRNSLLLGTLMNTRGLMELIILNIGLSLGVLSQTWFTMMVVMALATTLMTSPLMTCFAADG